MFSGVLYTKKEKKERKIHRNGETRKDMGHRKLLRVSKFCLFRLLDGRTRIHFTPFCYAEYCSTTMAY